MKAAKNGAVFAIYATPIANPIQIISELPAHYKEYQDVFKKKNTDMLSQHHSYYCGINL